MSYLYHCSSSFITGKETKQEQFVNDSDFIKLKKNKFMCLTSNSLFYNDFIMNEKIVVCVTT